jgi:hypothetical protein
MAPTEAPEEQLVAAATPLTVPCTLQQLRGWLGSVDVLTPGKEKNVTVSATASSITVA